MADLTPEAMAAKLIAAPFERSGPAATALTDPIADTPMVVTLDELKPYDLNPRVTRNPRYEDIKASISARGLDAPPAITRRPGESHYIIRSGGNTRLAILRELWAETKDERFFRIPCLFRPWTARGEIVALTGHLAENELHGGLTFIERALGLEKARELYERESGQSLSQSELARRLTADGYPITQPHISRMQDAVRFLLPAIPSILYAGLGKPQIERLAMLRKGAERAWEHHAGEHSPTIDFPALWQEVLASFEAVPADFSAQRAQDELVGQMAQLLGVDYDALALEVVDLDAAQRAQSRELVLSHATPSRGGEVSGELNTDAGRVPPAARKEPQTPASPTGRAAVRPSAPPQSPPPRERTWGAAAPADRERHDAATAGQDDTRIAQHIVSPVETSGRLEAIERTIAEATGEHRADFEHNVLHAIPVQAGGLHPISDVWYIERGLDTPERLRAHIAQFAREIAHEAGLAPCIESVDEGIGFVCVKPRGVQGTTPGLFARGVLALLGALSGGYVPKPRVTIEGVRLADDLAPMLLGYGPAREPHGGSMRLTDAGLVKLFRLIRLARRLIEWDSGTARPIDDR
jgi:ParB family protein of integrating conjugative element (PFGI_1 class)